MTESKGFVVLDTSVLDGIYLRPLLKGETCRDVRAISDHGYTPAVLQKSLAEVWAHAKLGDGNAAWWTRESTDFPGPIDRMVSIIERAEPNIDAQTARKTAWLWFNLAEEWYGSPEDLDAVQREFLVWKQSMEAFCARVEAALVAQALKLFHHGAFSRLGASVRTRRSWNANSPFIPCFQTRTQHGS